MTIEFYDQRSEDFVRETASLDMSHLYDRFLPLIEPGGRILDAGCGPGRDSRAFLDRGYAVEAIDASARMVELASERMGRPARQMRFQDLDYESEFSGIWACASLLHVPAYELGDVLRKLTRTLREPGYLYMSFQEGEGARSRGGRYFNDQTDTSLREILGTVPGLETKETWVTADARPGRSHVRWLNCIAYRTP